MRLGVDQIGLWRSAPSARGSRYVCGAAGLGGEGQPGKGRKWRGWSEKDKEVIPRARLDLVRDGSR